MSDRFQKVIENETDIERAFTRQKSEVTRMELLDKENETSYSMD